VAGVDVARPRRAGLRLADHRRAVLAFAAWRWADLTLVAALVAVSLALRTVQLSAGFWIDEGISVGIAHHHWTSIPHVLRQDGSPPAYYMLLGLWIRLFGDGERATHVLSLIFALACIPAAYLAGRSIFDRRTGLLAALLAAFDPYLTYYGQETRMYSMEAFLSLVMVVAYVNGILRGSRAWCIALVPTLALMVYAHNWALFLCVAVAAATLLCARDALRRFAVVAAGVAVLYLPWVPTLLAQVQHTGAPWSTVPSFHEMLTAPGAVLGGDAPFMPIVVVAAGGLYATARRIERSLFVIVAVTVICAWIVSQFNPAWTTRYFSVVFAPVVLLAAAAIVRGRRYGVVAIVAIFVLWWGFTMHDDKENARGVAARLATVVHGSELIVSTHPEQIPVLRYYLGKYTVGEHLRYATTMGPVKDPRVFDWYDAVQHLRDAKVRQTLDGLLATVKPGNEFVVITPVFRDYRAWDAKWTRLVWEKSEDWTNLLEHDPNLRLVGHVTPDEIELKRNYFKPLQAFVYRKLR
jgi:hypothetical protein